MFPLLQLNTLEIDNIKSFQLAVFNETGLVLGMEPLVYNNKTTNSGWFSTTDINFLNPCITLKLDDLDLNSVDFIKMDIQGGEIKALEGLSKTIIKCKPIIFIEIEEHHLVKNNSNSRNVLNYFSFLNYDVYRFETSYPTDYVAVPKNSIMDWLKSGYKVTKCPEKTT